MKTTSGRTTPANTNKPALQKVGVVFGTFFGAGYFPLGPGTFASAIVATLYFFFWPAGVSSLWLLAPAAALYFPSVWAAGQCEDYFHKHDPGKVVIDEVIGQMMALAAVPAHGAHGWKFTLLGFILFRLFDIVKPFPVRHSERLPRGYGIITDDCLAGAYAFGLLKLVVTLTGAMG